MEAWEYPVARVDSLVIQASRNEVEAQDIRLALATLNKLLPAEVARRTQARVHFVIRGYEHDPRDLWEVPEVRTWVQALDKEFPYWFYFLELGPKSTLAFIAFSVCGYEHVLGGKRIPVAELQQFLLIHFMAMNRLCRRIGDTSQMIDRRSQEIREFFFSEQG